MPPFIEEEKCTGCGTCARICPMQIFVFEAEKQKLPEVRFGEECWHCHACEQDCPQGAVRVRLPLPLMMPYIDAALLHPEKQGGNHA